MATLLMSATPSRNHGYCVCVRLNKWITARRSASARRHQAMPLVMHRADGSYTAEAEAILPANAVGRDFRPYPYAGLTDSGTGIEASLWGIVGVKLGWVEGVEVNFLGLVAGLDLRHPGVKLPGFGRIGLPQQTAIAAPAR